MKVSKSYPISNVSYPSGVVCTHSIEIGISSWSDEDKSIRNRYDHDGHFSPHSSSEIPIADLANLASIAIINGLLSAEDLLQIQASLQTFNIGKLMENPVLNNASEGNSLP